MRHPEHRTGEPVAPPDAAQLAQLLARWRSTFDPEAGAAIEALGPQFPDVALELPRQQGEAAKRWTLRVAEARADELSSLLAIGADLVDRVAARTSWPMVETLVGLPEDPRVARFALQYLLGSRTPTYFPTKLRRRMFDAVEKHADVRAIAALRTLEPAIEPHFAERLANLVKKIAKRVEKAAASPRPVVAIDGTDRRGDELLAAIYEAPHDDGRRQVYADWLLEREDPRGELINLQLQRVAGQQTRKGAAREAALIKKHARTWYAGIWSALVPASVELERGFLARCTLNERVSRTKAALVMARPEWATVESIELCGTAGVSSTMRSLRAVHGLRSDELALLARARVEALDELGVVVVSPAILPILELIDRMSVHALALDVQGQPRIGIFGTLAKTLQTRSGATLRAFAMTGTSHDYWRDEAWDWRLLEASPLAQFRLSLDRWSSDRLDLQRTDGVWDTLGLQVRQPQLAVDWEEVLSPFRGRALRRLQIATPPGHDLSHTALWQACAQLAPVEGIAHVTYAPA